MKKKMTSGMRETKHLGKIIVLVLLCLSLSTIVIASEDIDKTPLWYNGSKPWTSISREGREEILRIRRGYEASKAKANQPSTEVVAADSAKQGEQLIRKIHKKYGIHSFYATPSMFGSRMVIWLPESAWEKLSSEQKASIESYMKSKYANWGIGVGRVSGTDIMADRLEISH